MSQPSLPSATADDPLVSTSVELSFNTSKGGAWDDRELIRASEAAMKEFHVHHPGPGSWLDKATAALAAGRALPGGEDYGTQWYKASLPPVEAESSTQAQIQAQTQTQKKSSNKKRRTNGNNTAKIDYTVPNPYDPSSNGRAQRDRANKAASPSYQPLSPGAADISLNLDNDQDGEDDYEEDEEEEDEEYDEEDEEYDEEAEWGEGDWVAEDYYPYQDQDRDYDEDHPYDTAQLSSRSHRQKRGEGYGAGAGAGAGYTAGAGQGPSVGVQPIAGISRDDAMGYAMTAQYWAGYWMGVVQAQGSQSSTQTQGGGRRKRRRQANGNDDNGVNGEVSRPTNGVEGAAEVENEEGTNLFITKKQLNRPAIDGLRR